MIARRRRPPPPKDRTALLLFLLLPLVFLLGRQTAERTEVAAPACPPAEPGTKTSTAGLCPCPAPRKARPKKIQVLPIPKKETPPTETAPFERDPTEPTAKYLRAHASDLSQCAPNTGARVRVHFEVQVSPSGAVEKVRITNLEPLPPDIASCVDRTVHALSPPGFDGVTAEIFALTVVL